MNELQDVEEIISERERFRVETIDQANWALRKISALKAKLTEVQQLAEAEQRRIAEWLHWEQSKLNDSVAFFESLLGEYALRQREADPAFKKLSTPYGTVKLKKNADKWEYDDKKLLESLESAGLDEFIRIKKEPNKVELKKNTIVQDGQVIHPETGAILEGVQVVPQPESVVVEV